MLDESGNSTLHWAVFNPNSENHREIAKYLISKGVNIELGNKTEGQTPFHWACIAGNIRGVLLLLEYDVDPLHADKRGYNSLHHAAQYNEILICYYLIQKGVPVDCQDDAGHTPLHWASYLGYDNLMRLLLNCRANINQQDNAGFTPLHWAATKAQVPSAQVLIENGADISIIDNKGDDPLFAAQKKGYFGLAFLMSKRNAFYSNYRTTYGVSNINFNFCLSYNQRYL